MKATQDDIGKRVTFRAPTRWGLVTSTRIIRKVLDSGGVEVMFAGWDDFMVRPREISKIRHNK